MAVIGESGSDRAERGSVKRLLRRLRADAPVLAVTCVVLGAMAIADDVRWYHAVAGFLVVVAAAALLPRAFPRAPDGARRVEPAPRPPRALDRRALMLISAVPDPCILVERRGVVVMHNERARAIVPGLRSGDPLSFVLREPDIVEALREVTAGGPARSVPVHERVPIERWYLAHLVPIHLEARETEHPPDYVLMTIHDETNQHRLERLRVDFVANASHELRTPLASLSGFIETLQGPARNDTAARERFLGIMHGQAVRMSRLIDDLLSLSRIELNAHVRPTAIVDLRSVAAQTVDALGPLARENNVVIAFDAPAEPFRVRGDRDELYRVCENLIENAIKYGSDGGNVEVTLRRTELSEGQPSSVVLTVKDYGPGIEAEHLPRLTERFYRVDAVSSRAKGGTGLGLAIVKHILARHRARLAVESRPGEGATFTVHLDAETEVPA